LLLLLLGVVAVVLVLLLLDELALLLLTVVVTAVVPLLRQSVGRDGEPDGGGGEERDQGAEASHDGATSPGSRMTTVIPYRQGALHVTPLSHRRDEDHTALMRTLKRAS
jgi:alpha/beta superfamily hydrolase